MTLPAGHRTAGGLDPAGLLLGGGGLLLVVHGFGEAATAGWAGPLVLAPLLAGTVLLICFAAVERKATAPMLPLPVIADRVRGAALLTVLLTQVAMFVLFLFISYCLQQALGYSPLQAGVSFLPIVLATIVGASALGALLQPRLPLRVLLPASLLVTAGGMAMLTSIDNTGPGVYLTLLLPAQVLIGLGMGCALMLAMSAATAGVAPEDAGAASAAVNVAQQIGGSLGLALLNTIAASATAAHLTSHPHHHSQANVHGYNHGHRPGHHSPASRRGTGRDPVHPPTPHRREVTGA